MLGLFPGPWKEHVRAWCLNFLCSGQWASACGRQDGVGGGGLGPQPPAQAPPEPFLRTPQPPALWCTCGAGAKWCTHVVALCLFRIHNVSPPHLSWPCPPLHPLLLCCVPGHSVNPFASRTRPLCPQLRCWQVFPQIVSLLSVLPSGFCGLPAGPRVRVPVSAAEGPTAEICSVPHQ